MNKRKIGILGGTFNPIHIGHLAIARESIKKFGLNKVLFVPAYQPPHKEVADGVSPADRVNMVKLAIRDEDRCDLSLYEIDKQGVSYSVDTIEYFKQKFGPETELYFLTGADSAKTLPTWKEPEKILELAVFVVATRPGFEEVSPYEDRITRLEMPPVDVSAHAIRGMVKTGQPIDQFVPRAVVEYIRAKGLYKFKGVSG